jgi:kumamolisin
MQVESADAATRTVTVRGTVAQAKAAFWVSLGRYETGDLGYRGREGAVHVPADLVDVVQAVLGLDNRPQARIDLKRGQALSEDELPDPQARPATMLPAITARAAAAHSPRPSPQPMWPMQVASLYAFPATWTATERPSRSSSWAADSGRKSWPPNFDRESIPAPAVEAIGVLGGQNHPGADPNADGEVMLDIEVCGTVAHGARLAVYFSDTSDRGFHGALSAAVHDAERSPSVVSISWGAPEDAWTEQARQVFDDMLIDAAALGITVLAAAGDHGAGDRTKDGKAHADYPASSPYMIGCGGTTLFDDDGQPSEVAWNDGDGRATGGGSATSTLRRTGRKSPFPPMSTAPGSRGAECRTWPATRTTRPGTLSWSTVNGYPWAEPARWLLCTPG